MRLHRLGTIAEPSSGAMAEQGGAAGAGPMAAAGGAAAAAPLLQVLLAPGDLASPAVATINDPEFVMHVGQVALTGARALRWVDNNGATRFVLPGFRWLTVGTAIQTAAAGADAAFLASLAAVFTGTVGHQVKLDRASLLRRLIAANMAAKELPEARVSTANPVYLTVPGVMSLVTDPDFTRRLSPAHRGDVGNMFGGVSVAVAEGATVSREKRLRELFRGCAVDTRYQLASVVTGHLLTGLNAEQRSEVGRLVRIPHAEDSTPAFWESPFAFANSYRRDLLNLVWAELEVSAPRA